MPARRCHLCRRWLWPWQRRSPFTFAPAHRLCALEHRMQYLVDNLTARRPPLILITPPKEGPRAN